MYTNFMLFLLGLELCFQRTNRSIQELRTLQKLDGLIECIFNMHKYVYAEHQLVYAFIITLNFQKDYIHAMRCLEYFSKKKNKQTSTQSILFNCFVYTVKSFCPLVN